jgi:hypothetical protein
MQRLCLTIARFALSAWIGAAVLFVVTAVREATSPAFDSLIKNQLAALRFPPYYLFGFVLVGLGLVCGARGVRRQDHRRRWTLFVGALGLSLGLMLIDYCTVFLPLYEIVSHPEAARDERFSRLHQASTWLNFADVALCSVAAIAVCWPNREQ